MFAYLQDMDLNYDYMLIEVQGQITTHHVVLQRGAPLSAEDTISAV